MYLAIISILSSCGTNGEEIQEEGLNRERIKEEERIRMEVKEELEEEKRIEKFSSTIKIGNLEVMKEDLGVMTLYEAKKAFASLGDGWRLPTKDELDLLYENKEKIGGFASNYYWSSTEDNFNVAWGQNFVNGDQGKLKKVNNVYVRAVRAF